MAENFNDNIIYNASTLSVSGDAVAIGSTNAGAKSVIFNNSGSQGHLAWQPTANRSINLPDSGGTVQLTGQVPGAIYDGANSITSGTIQFTNANNISFSINGQTISGYVAAQTKQTAGLYAVSNTTQNSSTTLDARTLSFQGAGGVSVGYSNGSIVISGGAGGGGITNVNLSAGTTSNNLSAFVFSNSNNVSFGLNGSTITATITVPAQTNQTVGLYAVSNTTQNSSTTLDARTLSFQGAGIASVGYSNGSIIISVPSGGGAGDGVNIIAAGTQTANTTGTVVFSNSNNITFGMTNNSIVTASAAAQTNQTVGLYALGNTTQNSSTTLDARTLSFNGLGIITAGYSNGSIQISATQSAQTQNVVVPTAGTQTTTSGTVIFSNSNGISFGMSNSYVVTASLH